MAAQGNQRGGFEGDSSGYDPGVDDNEQSGEGLVERLEHAGEHLIERLRGTGVGVEDPNIVGDAGPTDIPPGRDPDSAGLFADPVDPLASEDPIEPVDSVEPPDLLGGADEPVGGPDAAI